MGRDGTNTTSGNKKWSNFAELTQQIKRWGQALGFQHVGITDIHLQQHEQWLQEWLDAEHHGQMAWMQRHGLKRSRPELLVDGTIRVISVRLDYLPEAIEQAEAQLTTPTAAYVSRYALGRDYHKVMRKRLQTLVNQVTDMAGEHGHRVFVDSAPVLEKALAEKAGLGWIGKHSNLIHQRTGSYFFLGEIYTSLPLLTDAAAENHCGSCSACLSACPTDAIIAPYKVDARRCISYHTIEMEGPIPETFRAAMGNRIYGCDDCQLACPWNKFAQISAEPDFQARHQLDKATLIELFHWDEATFLANTEGSAIRRIGHERWLRNIATALGNALRTAQEDRNTNINQQALIQALETRLTHSSATVREHVNWALAQARPNHAEHPLLAK